MRYLDLEAEVINAICAGDERDAEYQAKVNKLQNQVRHEYLKWKASMNDHEVEEKAIVN